MTKEEMKDLSGQSIVSQPKSPKPGTRRIIYDDPITERNPEGEATLIRRIGRFAWAFGPRSVSERWLVKFHNGDMVEREIRL